LADATAYARDRAASNGLPLGALFSADTTTRRQRPAADKHDARRPGGPRGSDAAVSAVGSDSDYHSDISNYSAGDYPTTRHYQPVLL